MPGSNTQLKRMHEKMFGPPGQSMYGRAFGKSSGNWLRDTFMRTTGRVGKSMTRGLGLRWRRDR